MENLATLLQKALDDIVVSIDDALTAQGHDGIRPAHGAVFDNLDSDGTRLSTLAARAGTSKQMMQYLVDPLVAGGYLHREPDPADGRGKLITLTERGRLAVAVAERAIADTESRWAEAYGAGGMRSVRRTLEQIAKEG